MESDDDIELLPSSSPVPQPKLKRLKKAIRVPQLSPPKSPHDSPLTPSPQLGTLPSDTPTPSPSPSDGHLQESTWGSSPQLDHGPTTYLDASESDTVNENGSSAVRALDFDSLADELDGNGDARSPEIEKEDEVADLKTDELDRKRRSLDDSLESEEKSKKKKRIDGDGAEKRLKESASNERKTEKEKRENRKQLRAESQRLLRETRDATFKPIPVVQKPISSILDKIRQRKLEILKKSSASFDDNDGLFVNGGFECASRDEGIAEKLEPTQVEEAPTCPAATNSTSLMAVGSKSEHTFRAPIGDTQELIYDSQGTDISNEAVCEEPSNPSEEVLAPSMLPMNLKLDSAIPDDDDDDVSSDDEDNDKENIDPHLHESVGMSSPPSGDPVKAFVDEEAEEEDDSDNDMQRFEDNEDVADDDIEDLNEMMTPEYKEKAVDREKRDELHQQWLEQQDLAGMDNLLQKLNCGSKLKESTLIEEEDEESIGTENEFDDEAEKYIAPSDAVKMNLKMAKQMIPRMFTDKDDAYASSDDEETEKRLAKQCLYDKAEEKATFLSPAEDESSREVFSLIKKLNIVPDPKRKGKTQSFFDMSLLGQKMNQSSKSSFIGRASNHFMPSSKKQGSSKVRSFIFGRDDSNSRTSVSMSEDFSDTIQRESQPPKAASAKFQRNTQKKYASSDSKSQNSSVSLLEILRSSSLHAKHCVQNARVEQSETIFDAFKLEKKVRIWERSGKAWSSHRGSDDTIDAPSDSGSGSCGDSWRSAQVMHLRTGAFNLRYGSSFKAPLAGQQQLLQIETQGQLQLSKIIQQHHNSRLKFTGSTS